MIAKFNKWWLWLALNAGAIAVFFAFAVKTWIEPELANVPGASGGAFIVWGTTALPLFVLFVAANLALGIKALRDLAIGERRAAIVVALALMAWVAAFYFDHIHHGI